MSEHSDERKRKIAELEAELRALRAAEGRVAGDTISGDKLGGDKVAGDKVVEPQGTVNVDAEGRIDVAVGINLGRIIYGVDPTDAQREQLTRYLRRLAAKMWRLPL